MMIKVLFLCHGNICRSPMAEFVFKDMVARKGLAERFAIASAATSREEIGNDIHRGTKKKLDEADVPYSKRKARQITRADYDEYDYILLMDEENRRGLNRIIGSDSKNKVFGLLDFSENPRAIADPWYTGNFDITYDDILEGCETFLSWLKETGKK